MSTEQIVAYLEFLDLQLEDGRISAEEYESKKADLLKEPTLEGSRLFDENRMLAYTANSLVKIQASLEVILQTQAELYAQAKGGHVRKHYNHLNKMINDALQKFHKEMFSQATESDEKITNRIETKRKAKAIYEAKKKK